MSSTPNIGVARASRPLGTFFRWEIPTEGISVHLNLRIIELMERDASQAGGKAVAGVLLGRPHRGRDLTLTIEHYEMATLDGETLDSPFANPRLAESILERWRPGRSRMSILGLYRTTAGNAVVNSDDTAALAKVFETEGANSKNTSAPYASRVTPILEDPDQIFLLIGPRTERISKASLYLLRKGAVVCESPQIPFDRAELAKIGSAGQPQAREPRPSSTQEPRFTTQDIPAPPPEPKREPRKEPRRKAQLPGQDLNIPNWMWPVLALPALGLVIALFYWTHGKQQPTAKLLSTSSEASTTSVLGLKLDQSGPSWKLSWNETAAAVQGAAKGRLLITDGGVHRTIELAESDLHGGTIIYTPVTGDVILQLEVDSQNSEAPISETVRVVGGLVPPLESPQTADAVPLPASGVASSAPNPGGMTSLASQPGTPAPQMNAPTPLLNSNQTAANFPSSATKAMPPPPASPYAGLTPQPTPQTRPLVASEMPEPYRSLMMRSTPALTQPVPASKPVAIATDMPAPYRVLMQPVTKPSQPGKAVKLAVLADRASHSSSRSLARTTPPEVPRAVAPNAALALVSKKPAPALAAKTRPSAPALEAATPAGSGGEVETAQLVSRADPEYPAKAREGGIAGNVEVHFRIGKDGQVHDVMVVQGVPLLSQAAVQAVLKWRYKPARVDGAPADSDANAVFSFKQN